MDGVQTPPGITEGNQSYYTGNSFTVPHSVLQSLRGTPVNSEQLPAFIQEVNAPTSSGVTSSPLLSCSAVSSQATVAPIRNGTGGVSRSLKPSRRSPSLSFYSASESQLLLLNRLNHLFPTLFWRLLCRRLHLTTPLRMCLRRRLLTQTRFRVTRPFRRLSLVPLPFRWMLLRRRSHPALRLSTSLRRWVLAQLPRSVDASVQITAHSAVLIDAATQLDLTEFLIGSDRPFDRRHPFCQSSPSVLGAHVAPLPPPGLEQPTSLPVIATQPQSLTNVSSSHCPILQPTASTTHVGTHPVRPAGAKKCQYRPCGKPQLFWPLSSY